MKQILLLVCIMIFVKINAQQIIWQNDFSNSIDWATNNDPAGNWTITTNASAGPVPNLNPAAFSTVANGYAIIDASGAGANATQNAWIYYTGSINLSSQSNVVLQFQQTHRRYCSTTYVIYSLDGGITWGEVDVNAEMTSNTNTTNPAQVQVNLSNIIGGQPSVKIGFKFIDYNCNGWFWAVDDVKLLTPPLNDLSLEKVIFGSTGSSGAILPYYKIPISQISPIEVSGLISNNGTNNQNNVIFTSSVSGTTYSSSSTSTFLSSFQSDTISTMLNFTPPSLIGTYIVNCTVSGNLENNLSNNSISGPSIEVTANIYSRDNGILDSINLSGSSNQSSQGGIFKVGNLFDIYNNDNLGGIEFYVHPSSVVGTEVYVELYSIDPTTGDFVYEGDSNPYILTTADLGQKITLPFINGNVTLNGGESYLVLAGANSGGLIVGSAGVSEPQTSFIYIDNTWYFTTSTPMVRMVFCNGIPTINQTLNISDCAPFFSPTNQIYLQSGTYNEVIPYINGCCDSVLLTINLTILNSPNNSFTTTICNGDTYTWNNQQYTQPGQYSQTLTNQFGCDSVVILTLNVDTNDNISITPNPAFGNAPLNVAFANQTPNLSNYNFTWYFGDGTSQQSNSPFLSHIYTQNGYADVTVVADNLTTGCSSSQTFNDLIFVIGGVTCTHTATINQSGQLTGCVGDSILLSSNTDPSFTYQWNKNGIPVSGATSSSFYPTQSGSYTVTIYQNNCPVTSAGISVTMNALPSVPNITSSGTIVPCSGGSMTLTAPSGFTNYLWNTGSTASSLVVSQSGNYSVSVTNSNGCQNTSNPFTVNASFMAAPQVCIVGVDSLTNENRVVWEKPLTQGIDSFYVYKETNVSNVYTKIGATDYNQLAVFLDVNSNPAVQAYRYKISALDTCGVETNVGDFHKTIHLTINQGIGGAWNLIWSHYEGLTFGSYNIYRGTDPSNISLLTTIQSNLNSYTDLTPPTGPLYYQIEVVNPVNCDPTKIVNYGVSRSNIVNNGVSGVQEIVNTNIVVYPNPTNSNITLEVSSELVSKMYSILDFSGRIIQQGKINSIKEHIDLQHVARGAYYLSIENSTSVTKIVKQ